MVIVPRKRSAAAMPVLLALLLLLIFLPTYTHAIGQYKVYGTTDIDTPDDWDLHPAGGFAVCGREIPASSPSGPSKLWVARLSSAGSIVWQQRYDFSGFSHARMMVAADGSIVIAGAFTDPSVNSQYPLEVFLLKLDGNGQIQWSSRINGVNNEALGSLAQSPNGNYIFSFATSSYGLYGSQNNNNGLSPDMVVMEVNAANGAINWARSYGAWHGEAIKDIETTSNSIIVSGNMWTLGQDLWVLSTDLNGNQNFQRRITTNNSSRHEEIYDLTPTSDGGWIGTGFHGPSTNYNALLIKFNSSFGISWAKQIGGSGDDRGARVLEHGGNFYVGGYSRSFASNWDALLMKFDLNGNLQWGRTYGDGGTASEYVRGIKNDGGTLSACLGVGFIGHGLSDFATFTFDDAVDSCMTDVTAQLSVSNVSFTTVNSGSSRSENVTTSPLPMTLNSLNMQQQTVACGTVSTIPTLSQWGLILLGLSLLCIAAMVLHHRQSSYRLRTES